jgi:uncharacterized repeat protein (TIGR03803 family)
MKNYGWGKLAAGLSVLAAFPFATTVASAQSETVLYSFPSHSGVYARPYEDPTGALYVPTYYGRSEGSVVELTEKHGAWKGRTIYNFQGNNGQNPDAVLNADPNGVLYGTTQNGGIYGRGTVYSLASVNGVWTETVLYNFTGGVDGNEPTAGLVRDKATGTLYGSTPSGGGNSGCGTAFSLVPSNGKWTFVLDYTFAGGSDGCSPDSGLRKGMTNGTFFGTTQSGGARNEGTVFELAEKNGVWFDTVLYSFSSGAGGGITPVDLDIDQDGNLFGVTSGGGNGLGVVFELSRVHRRWKQSVLYTFNGGINGSVPVGLHLDQTAETLYGTTELGGADGYGTLFKLVKNASYWTETVLHSFGTTRYDGLYPQSRPTEDPQTGVLYGTTNGGGTHAGGTVYEIVP